MLAIYTRLSQEDEDSNSILNQITEGKAFAKLHKFEIVEVYNEGEGVSGSRDIKSRPVLSNLVKDIQGGKITAIWARNQNRIERSTAVYVSFVKLVKQHNVKVYFADKEVDFNDANQKLQGTIFSGMSEYLLDLQSIQIKKVLSSRAEEGKISGHICYGYMRDADGFQVPHPEKSKLVKEIFIRYSEGESVPKICDDFNKREIPPIFYRSNKSGKWSYVGLYGLLRNTTYFGDKNHGGKVYSVPKIIDKDLFNRVQARLKIGTAKSATRNFYILSGLLTCGTCGNRVAGRSFGSEGVKYYMCSKRRYGVKKCSCRIVRMHNLDNLIWDALFKDDTTYKELKRAYLEGDNSAEKNKARVDIKHFTKEIEKQKRQIMRIKDGAVEGLFTIKEGKVRVQEVESGITASKDKIAEAEARLKDLNGERKLLTEYKTDRIVISKAVLQQIIESPYNYADDDDYYFPDLPELEANKSIIGKDVKEKSRLIKKYVDKVIIHTIGKCKFEIHLKFKLPIEDKTIKLRY